MIGKTLWSKGRKRLEEIENVAQKQRIQSISIQIKVNVVKSYTVKPLLADTPNSGHLLYSEQCAMYQVLLPFITYLRNLRLADTS